MQNSLLAFPYNLMVVAVGCVIAYSLLHMGTDKEIDVNSLKDGKHFVLRDKVKEGVYNATIYVKSPDKVVEMNGVVDGLLTSQPGQLVDFKATDKDCSGMEFKFLYLQATAEITFNAPIPRACQMYGNLKDTERLVNIAP
ncbi:hypothetical protein D3C81_989130 [compost metagenome]